MGLIIGTQGFVSPEELVSFHVADADTGGPIWGVSIILTNSRGSTTYMPTTGSDGNTSLYMPSGTYAYSASKVNFAAVQGTITAPESVSIMMKASAGEVPEDAILEFNIRNVAPESITLTRVSDGAQQHWFGGPTFFLVDPNTEYHYEIKKTGYATITGRDVSGGPGIRHTYTIDMVEVTVAYLEFRSSDSAAQGKRVNVTGGGVTLQSTVWGPSGGTSLEVTSGVLYTWEVVTSNGAVMASGTVTAPVIGDITIVTVTVAGISYLSFNEKVSTQNNIGQYNTWPNDTTVTVSALGFSETKPLANKDVLGWRHALFSLLPNTTYQWSAFGQDERDESVAASGSVTTDAATLTTNLDLVPPPPKDVSDGGPSDEEVGIPPWVIAAGVGVLAIGAFLATRQSSAPVVFK